LNGTDRKNASPDAPKADDGDGSLREEAIMLGWILLDVLVSLALVTLAVSLLPAFQADVAGSRPYASEESPVGFALVLAVPVFLIVNGMRRGFLNHAVAMRHARALDQMAVGSVAAVLVMAFGYAQYGHGYLRMLLPLYLPAVMVPAGLVIFGLHFRARREEARWARELEKADQRSEAERAIEARSAGRAWISVALLTAAASAAFGISTLVPSRSGADEEKEDAQLHYPMHAVTGAGKEE